MLAMALLIGCIEEDRGSIEDSTIYAIGDSVMEWNIGNGSIPEEVGEMLGQSAYNAAISGSMMSTGEDWSIPNQYVSGNWEWVIIDGGANDLNELCGCGPCESVQANLSNSYRTLVESIRSEDVRVVIWGYYGIPTEAPEFGNCNESIDELSQMQSDLADEDDGVLWVSGKVDITGEDLSYYDDDLIHPSIAGSRKIAEQIVEAIESAQ